VDVAQGSVPGGQRRHSLSVLGMVSLLSLYTSSCVRNPAGTTCVSPTRSPAAEAAGSRQVLVTADKDDLVKLPAKRGRLAAGGKQAFRQEHFRQEHYRNLNEFASNPKCNGARTSVPLGFILLIDQMMKPGIAYSAQAGGCHVGIGRP
jgi:hypothetical protein